MNLKIRTFTKKPFFKLSNGKVSEHMHVSERKRERERERDSE